MSPTTSEVNSYALYDDPLYISNSDQPLLQIVNVEFDGNNFLTWKREVYLALIAKNKDGFVDGSCKMPEKSDKKYNQWYRCDLLVTRWILNSIDKQIKKTLKYCKSSKELWKELMERYGQVNALEVYQLKKDLNALSQSNSALVDYYAQMKEVWESIDDIDPMPICLCGALDKCSCSLLKRLLDRESNAKLIQFLMGLNSAFENVKTTVLTMDPLPPLNKALGLLQKIERQKQISDAIDVLEEATAYASTSHDPVQTQEWKKQKINSDVVEPSTKFCTFCKHYGHIEDTCFKKYPCIHCGRRGHASENCYFKLKNQQQSYKGGDSRNKGKGKVHYNNRRNVYKHGAHNAEVFDVVQTDNNTPLDYFDQHQTVDDDVHPTSQYHFDRATMDGLVNTVVQEVVKVISDKSQSRTSLSASNFAGLGFVTSLLFVFLVGVFVSSWLGASVFWLGEWLIKKMPFVRHIYSASKQISSAISPDQNTTAFKEVAIICHPRVGEYAFGFITSSVTLQRDEGDEELCSVFVPTNHLYIGDIFLVNSKDVIRPNLSIREGIEIIVSGGMTMPQLITPVERLAQNDDRIPLKRISSH